MGSHARPYSADEDAALAASEGRTAVLAGLAREWERTVGALRHRLHKLRGGKKTPEFRVGDRVEFLSHDGVTWKPGVVAATVYEHPGNHGTLRIRTSADGRPGVWVVRKVGRCRHVTPTKEEKRC